jgi:UDP-3-O-[3-hydroxymyristoyl] glucosamine N-acyltransferase
MRFLGMVEAYAGRLEPIDSPRGESIFVTWSPKIFIEASALIDTQPTAVIHESAMIRKGCKIGVGCYVGKNVVLDRGVSSDS